MWEISSETTCLADRAKLAQSGLVAQLGSERFQALRYWHAASIFPKSSSRPPWVATQGETQMPTTTTDRSTRRSRQLLATVQLPLPERPSTAAEIAALASTITLLFAR